MDFIITSNLKLIGSVHDFKGVFRAANAVAEDFRCIFDSFGDAVPYEEVSFFDDSDAIIFGTIGKSAIIHELENRRLLSVSELKEKREVYKICHLKSPLDGINNALVIVGSDKRGSIYGLYHLSEMCGISPLRKWSGCIPERKNFITLHLSGPILSKEPSVKYRGIFINDEWPAFGNWAASRFGGINAGCYEQVFEFILRLKGNYLWPAMWASCFCLDGPGLASAELADEMGIVISSSHHEPCMRAGAEYGKMRGKDSPYGDAWDFVANPEGITKFWEDGLKRNAPYENVITLGMRGENDTAIMENATLADNISLLREVLHTQNELIRKNVQSNIQEVPRQIVLFTEVEKFFYGDENTKGLIGDPETDGVCIMLSDSNFGYTRTLPTSKMREHNGGYGMYYHIDMHGGAHAYEWVGTSLLPRMWEQMSMAYDYGVRDIWVVNVGDIATQELGISYFMDLAYDFDTYGTSNPNNTDSYIDSWVKKQFGSLLTETELYNTSEVLKIYSQICERRKHEIMNDSVYHPVHFNETEHLIADCERIWEVCDAIKKKYPCEKLTGFWELVYYPCVGTANLMRTWCYASQNKLYAKQNRNEANFLADKIREGIQFDRKLTDEFHKVADGKFYGFGLSEHFGFTNWSEDDNKYPLRIYTEPANKPRMIVSKADNENYSIGKTWVNRKLTIDDFLRPDVTDIVLDIACGSKDEIEYRISCDKAWLRFSQTTGKTTLTDKVVISIDRDKIKGKDTAVVTVSELDHSTVTIVINAENKSIESYEPMTFFEYDGYIAMEAEHYYQKHDTTEGAFACLKPYGRTGSAMKIYPTIADFKDSTERPYLEYLFHVNLEGIYRIEFFFGPSMPVTDRQEMLAGVCVNDCKPVVFNTVAEPDKPFFTSRQWEREAHNNIKVYSCTINCIKGINTLKYYQISPNLALERIVLYPASGPGLLASYLGPKESFYVKKREGKREYIQYFSITEPGSH